ncbi:MAG: translocation/assembly module TamB domain-containing protein, partial [Muribaculaceae bacterium]|nr:translocation/assembly module TamB domain-containing protein [Muribaculaceae bacterium]
VSSLKLFTKHNAADTAQEAVTLQLSDVKLQDWLAINPFAPAMKGDLSADMSFSWTDRSLDGAGTVSLADFTYGRQRVGSFNLDTKVQTSGGIVRATADMFIDGQKALTLNGNLNDSTKTDPFLLDLRVISLPLRIANPFLGADVASLSGSLKGEMDVTGEISSPILNGWLQFDSAAVKVPMLGSSFMFSDGRIPVDSSVVRFDNYAIMGLNKNPLVINGSADIRNFADIPLSLSLNARNMQIVNGKKGSRGVDVYGKAYIDLDASVKGSTSFLNVDAALALLPGTNVTYVMPDAVNTISSQSDNDMVRFVNFADTAAVAAADSIQNKGMLLNLDASLTVSSGTTIGVDLSADGKDRVQIQGDGTIK